MAFNPGGGGSGSISTSTDVALNTPANNQVLSYSSGTGKWVNATSPGTLNPRGAFTVSTPYAVNDLFLANGQTYRVINAHTSGGGPPSVDGPWTNLELFAARGADGGVATVDSLPAGCTLTVFKNGAVWPARPTNRTDIIVQWRGPDPSPAIVASGTGGMLDNVDIRLITP